ncbi:MAG: DbpA RNA binding domain-containing protein, partial [Planctomycetota bacterium]
MSDAVEEAPLAQFKSSLILSLEEGNLELFEDLVKEVASETGKTPVEVAAACARLTRRAEEPGVLERIAGYELQKSRPDAKAVRPVTEGDDSTPYRGQGTSEFRPRGNDRQHQGDGQGWKPVEEGMTRLFVNVGRMDGVRPGDLVGAIAGESGIEGSSIGSIDIFSRYSFVEVPEEKGEQVISSITGVQVRGRAVQARPATPPSEGGGG